MNKILIYTTTNCPACKMAKEYLTVIGLKYDTKNIEDMNEDELETLIRKTKSMKVPVIQIDETYIIGFDKEKIKKALKGEI